MGKKCPKLYFSFKQNIKFSREHANKILTALKENPLVAVPQVHMRMSDKENEWKAVREEYNVIWRDQVEKNYLKSLDYQAATFKANDVKNIRSRGLIATLETIYEEVELNKFDKTLTLFFTFKAA